MIRNPEIRLQIIFTASHYHDDYRNKPILSFLSVRQNEGLNAVQQGLDDWYMHEKKYEAYAKKYPIDNQITDALYDEIKDMYLWCEMENIQYTPTIFINSQELPHEYSIRDLLYLI